jgi:hypothetical protein
VFQLVGDRPSTNDFRKILDEAAGHAGNTTLSKKKFFQPFDGFKPRNLTLNIATVRWYSIEMDHHHQ